MSEEGLSPVHRRKGGSEIEIGHLQRQVLSFVWEHPGCTVRECRDHIEAESKRDYAYTTIQTVFDSLHRKKLVSRSRTKNAYHYKPKQSKGALLSQGLQELLQRFGVHSGPVMSCLVDALEDDPEELGTLISELRQRGHLD